MSDSLTVFTAPCYWI